VTATLEAPTRDPVPPAARPDWRARLRPAVTARGGWLATAVVGLVAGLLRFVRLDLPAGRIFDEVYYSCDAQNLLRYGVEHDTLSAPDDPSVAARCEPEGGGAFIVHPPLGKWAIALGIRLFGANELGWRFAAAVAGTLMAVVLVRIARRMTGSTLLGCLAGLLLALDGLHFVQSRVAMLDIFLAMWVLFAFGCLVTDRDAVRRRLAACADDALAGSGPRLGVRPWRLAAGVCLGAAVATKWSGLYYVVVLVLLAFAWEVGARRTAGVRTPVRATLARSTAPALAALVLLPAVLYLASWAGWFAGDLGYDRDWAATHPASGVATLVPDALRSWAQYHREIYGFHSGLTADHPYESHPAGWLVLARPVSYYYPAGVSFGDYGCEVEACSREVLAIGTPAIWWATIPALLALVWLWVSRRDWRAAATLAMVAAAIAPWIRDDLGGRTMFLFYALPAVPFMALALTLVAGWALGGRGASRRRRGLAAAAVGFYVALVVANFAYFYPVLAAQTIPTESWSDRMWLSSWV
jgi:dolichyl-phosphate-mannose-protein mannosyltransferase